MAARLLRTFPSRRETGRGHNVMMEPTGKLFCTCEAGEYDKECWALKIIAGEIEHDRLMQKIRQKMYGAAMKLPDQAAKRKEQQEYVYGILAASKVHAAV